MLLYVDFSTALIHRKNLYPQCPFPPLIIDFLNRIFNCSGTSKTVSYHQRRFIKMPASIGIMLGKPPALQFCEPCWSQKLLWALIPHELDSTQKKNSRETLSLPYLISRFDLFIKHFLIFRVVIFKIIMVRVGEDQGILTLEHQRHSRSITLTMWSSLRSRAIVSQERIRVYSYACFG